MDWRAHFVAVVAMVAGCGRLLFDEARRDAVVDVDAPFPTGPFGAPTPIVEINTLFDEDDASMTDDLLELYVQSDRAGVEELWVATRPASDQPWGAPTPIAELSAGGNVNNPKVTPDGLAVIFSSGRAPTAGRVDIWLATRPDRSSSWAAPQRILEIETASDDYEPMLDGSRLNVYFTSDRGATNGEPWHASRASTSEPFGNIAKVTELATPQEDGGLWASDSGAIVLFQSNRGGRYQLDQATRASTAEPFGSVMLIPGIDFATDVTDVWMSHDGHTLLFTLNDPGNPDLYMATR